MPGCLLGASIMMWRKAAAAGYWCPDPARGCRHADQNFCVWRCLAPWCCCWLPATPGRRGKAEYPVGFCSAFVLLFGAQQPGALPPALRTAGFSASQACLLVTMAALGMPYFRWASLIARLGDRSHFAGAAQRATDASRWGALGVFSP